jgi:hypothetical protein
MIFFKWLMIMMTTALFAEHGTICPTAIFIHSFSFTAEEESWIRLLH